ncbi:MAG TPA: hypothetical protein DCY59_12145 [Micrococcaceae bacterium]|nr:hypothetical protein [Micrococcaceae bacterium]
MARKLATNPRILCASPAYLRRRGTPRSIEDIRSHDCIRLAPVGSWPVMVDGTVQRISVQGRIASSSVEGVRSACLQGLGIAMLTYWDVHRQLADGSLVEVELMDAGMEPLAVWAVTPTRKQVPARVQALLEALESHLQR